MRRKPGGGGSRGARAREPHADDRPRARRRSRCPRRGSRRGCRPRWKAAMRPAKSPWRSSCRGASPSSGRAAARSSAASSRSGRRPCAARAAFTAWSRLRLRRGALRRASADGATANSEENCGERARKYGFFRGTGASFTAGFRASVPLWGIGLPALRPSAPRALGQLRPRGDLELAVDAREVDLDRLRRDEERLGDVLVRHVLGGHLGDAALARGQRLEPAQHQPARAGAGRRELGLRPLLEAGGAELVRELEALAEVLARVGALVAAAQRGAELDERLRVLEPRTASPRARRPPRCRSFSPDAPPSTRPSVRSATPIDCGAPQTRARSTASSASAQRLRRAGRRRGARARGTARQS